jgi:uncharacterized membrane protein YczE
LITAAVGIGVMIFVHSMYDPDAHQAYLAGLIPLLIGVVLLGYSLFLAPKQQWGAGARTRGIIPGASGSCTVN